jgi:hypothetical protein
MNKTLVTALCATMALGACSSIGASRLNPFNWFGRSEQVQVIAPTADAADPRALVAQVTDLTLERMPGGVIVRATGLPPTQGYWQAELVARPIEDGKITYDFRVFPPITPQASSTTQSREVIVGAFLSNIKLDRIRQITVQGANNARTTSR